MEPALAIVSSPRALCKLAQFASFDVVTDVVNQKQRAQCGRDHSRSEDHRGLHQEHHAARCAAAAAAAVHSGSA